MKHNSMKYLVYVLSFVFLYTNSYAKERETQAYIGANQSGKDQSFDCSPSTSQSELNINNVRARLLAGGDFWWDGVETGKYEFPKVDPSSGQTSIISIFSGALWFTGRDDGGNLQCAAQTYRGAGRHDFYTGPLVGDFGDAEYSVCDAYDKHFTVYGEEISQFLAIAQANNGVVSSSQVPENILKWPGKANPYYYGTDLFYDEGSLAPFYDVDDNGVYDPTKGDFPIIGVSNNGVLQPSYADQMIFWVINDNGNVHGRTNGVPIGIQVNCLAFAYQTADALNDMTFYTFETIKKTPNPLFTTYMGVFVDPDLGTHLDDFIGCDTAREMAYVYNANACDPQYGCNPPITGIDFFEGPIGDDDQELGLSSFIYFNNTTGPQGDPDVAAEFRSFQAGAPSNEDGFPVWKDLTPIYPCGDGYLETACTGRSRYVYPGNPMNPSGWSEVYNQTPTISNTPDDRRFVQNSGPFTLVPGFAQRITIGVFSIVPDAYDGKPDASELVFPADDLAQSLFDNGFDIIDGPDAPTMKIRELDQSLIVNLVNEPGSNNFGELYAEPHALPTNSQENDSLYRFQGYLVYQLANAQVTAQDLDNNEKAKLIFQSDLKDDVTTIYNYEDIGAGSYNAILKVTGENIGASKHFEITEDLFATGTKALINNKKYYFAAVAYAYADYNPYPVTSGLPSLEIFKQGRNNFKVYQATPHVIDSRSGGTLLNAEAGDPLQVERLEGAGNGGTIIRLNDATESAIVGSASAFKDIIEYELGQDPIKAKVVDPLKLQDVHFELRFTSFELRYDTIIIGTDTTITSSYTQSATFSDSNTYVINVFNGNDGGLIESIEAERPFDRSYEQILSDYGVSVTVNLPESAEINLDNNRSVYEVLSSSLEYADPTKTWLNLVSDQGFEAPSNWIRAGSTLDNDNIFSAHQYDYASPAIDTFFFDPTNTSGQNLFETSLLNGTMAPYCLASNYGNPGVATSGRVEYLWGPAFRWDVWDVSGNTVVMNPKNTLDDLSSVSIVFTPNSDLWSDCIVFETGENISANEGMVPKGSLRAAQSGLSKFPGYAINLETGERLNIAFGEASCLGAYNGRDMLFNPTHHDRDILTSIPGLDGSEKEPIWGGMHFVYVFKTRYDGGQAAYNVLSNNPIDPSQGTAVPSAVADLYEDIMYTFIPLTSESFSFQDPSNMPTETRIDINLNTPFKSFQTSETSTLEGNNTLPRYRFNSYGKAPSENNELVGKTSLSNIRVVPNPYYAYSDYEESQIDNVVKIIGLPDLCDVSIYTLNGRLVRRFNRSVGEYAGNIVESQEISDAQPVNTGINLDNSLTWDLNNDQRIPIGSGVYIIHIDAHELGETVVKSVVFMRPTDVSNF